MHVLILPSWYFEKGTAQLRGRMFQQHAHALRKHGVEARILHAAFSPAHPFKKTITHTPEDDVPTTRISQWFPPKLNAYLVNLWVRKYAGAIDNYIEKEGRPDIIHAQSYLTGAVAAEIKRSIKIPFVYTERLSSVLTQQIPGRYEPLIRTALDQSDLNTVVSPGLQKKLETFTKKQIEIVPNFYDPGIFYPDPTIQKNKIFTWVTAGEPAAIKGLDILLEAYGQLLKNVGAGKMQLIMVDHIHEQKRLMRIVDQYGMPDEIHWAGLLPQNELAELFRKSHAYVSSSRVETFGKAILEALACGMPVIATKTDGARYIFGSLKENNLVNINDAVSLAKAMEHFMKNDSSLPDMNTIHGIAERFSEGVVINQWIRLYKNGAR